MRPENSFQVRPENTVFRCIRKIQFSGASGKYSFQVRPENTVFRCVRAFSSLEILQAGTVKGQNKESSNEASKKEPAPLCTVPDI